MGPARQAPKDTPSAVIVALPGLEMMSGLTPKFRSVQPTSQRFAVVGRALGERGCVE